MDLDALHSTGVDLALGSPLLIDWDGSVCGSLDKARQASELRHLAAFSHDQGLDLEEQALDCDHIVLCCVLERMSAEAVASTLASLAASKPQSLTVLLRREPSEERPLHTVLPITTWRALIEAAGFELVLEDHLPLSAQVGGDLIAAAWRAADLFPNEPRASYVRLSFSLLEAADKASDLEAVEAASLDLDYRRRKPKLATCSDRVILNVHHVQDVANLRPLLDAMDPRAVTILLRETAEVPMETRRGLLAFARARNIACIPYRRVSDLDWTNLRGVPVISASECNVWLSHALSRQLIETARAFGARTLLLQHGVWLDDNGGSPISFGSDSVLCWGAEHRESLDRLSSSLTGLALEASPTALSNFHVVGAPKFADAKIPADRALLASRLGLPIEAVKRVALIGTNFHWWIHGDTGGFDEAVSSLRGRHEDWLFILKPHPRESLQSYEHLRASNLIVFDEAVSLMLDFPTSRLIASVDVVASSLSSLLIDAAASGKPVFQYDTGTALGYDGISPRPLHALSAYLRDPSTLEGLVNEDLVRNYAEADHEGFYDRFLEILNQPADTQAERATAYVGAYNLIEQTWLQQTAGDVAISDIDLLDESGLFDEEFYVGQVGIEHLGGRRPIEHFLAIGGWRHLDPRPSFSSAWYHAGIKAPGPVPEIPVLHYLRRGGRAGLSPHPLVRMDWIRDQLGREVDMSSNPLGFYLREGDRLALSPCPLFDPKWYLSVSPDLANVPNLLEHYLVHGWREGRSPHPAFDADKYLALNPDVAASAQNPLLHYVQYGVRENRKR